MVAVLKKSMTLVCALETGLMFPIINTQRVELDTAPTLYLACVKSPKSIEFHVDAIVTNSIELTVGYGLVDDDPPPNTARVRLPALP